MTISKTHLLFVALFAPFLAVVGYSLYAFAASDDTMPLPVCENCDGTVKVSGKITVTRTPSAQTVKIRPTGIDENDINTAAYTVATKIIDKEVSSCPCGEISPVEPPSWTLAHVITFIPTADHPNQPATLPTVEYPTDPIEQEEGEWTVKVYAPDPGKWQIIFSATATYKLQDADGNEILDEGNPPKPVTVPLSGDSEPCTFKAVAGKYALTVWTGEKPSPDPSSVCSNKSPQIPRCHSGNCKARVSSTFNISLVEFKNGKWEDVDPTKMKEVKYSLAVEGTQTQIISFMALTGSKLNSPAERTLKTLRTSISARFCAREPGEKTATLSVTATLNEGADDIVLTDSDTITFSVSDFHFAVFVREATNDKDGKRYEMEGKGYHGFIDVGHAAWKIGISSQELPNIDNQLQPLANLPWGSSPASDPNIPFPLDKAMIDFAIENPKTQTSPDDKPPLVVSVNGELVNGGAGDDIKRYILKKQSDAVNALEYIRDNRTDITYGVPDNNCVDACIVAMASAEVLPDGFDMQKVKGKRKVIYVYSNGRKKEWTINLSIPKNFQTELNRLASQP